MQLPGINLNSLLELLVGTIAISDNAEFARGSGGGQYRAAQHEITRLISPLEQRRHVATTHLGHLAGGNAAVGILVIFSNGLILADEMMQKKRSPAERPTTVLELEAADWLSLDDTVMGGVSSSRMVVQDDNLRFEGVVSLENNGGFASVRRALSNDLMPVRAVRLAVRGDGSRYQVRLRADDGSRSPAWRHVFQTTGDWQQLEIPLDAFEPVFRGRLLEHVGQLDPQAVRVIGFMTGEKRAGPFALTIRRIELIH